jgi:hypothetical protein
MSKRVLAVLSLAILLGACNSTNPSQAYTSPGWYLERPRPIVIRGPEIFAGPFSYDQCEAERLKFDPPTAQRLICIRELTKPSINGPF